MRFILVLLAGLNCLSLCTAAPIMFIHEGSGAGSLGGVPFNTTPFVITALAETANRSPGPSVYTIDHSSAQITLDGMGTYAFTTPTRTFVNQNINLVGFARATNGRSDLFDGPTNGAYGSWNMLTSIGPHFGQGFLTQWASDITTTGGILLFNEASSPATFRARLVPEPSGVMLVLLAALGCCVMRKYFA